jgi:hypothetical protein
MAPDAVGGARGRAREPELRGEEPERLLPLVAPDPEVDVDDVVVGDGEVSEPVGDRERPVSELAT